MINIKPSLRARYAHQGTLKTLEKLSHILKEPPNKIDYIHSIRTSIKRLRGWLRVLHIKNDVHNWKDIDKNLKEIAKTLGSYRDDEVVCETLELLHDKASKTKNIKIISQLQKKLSKRLDQKNINWKNINKALLHNIHIYKKNYVLSPNEQTIKKGINKLYKHILKHGKIAFSNNESYKELHKLRKWVKYLNYQLIYLHGNTPYHDDIESFKKGINKLGNRLGKLHDLVVIKEKIEKETDNLNMGKKLIDKKINELITESNKTYQHFFKLPQEKFISLLFK